MKEIKEQVCSMTCIIKKELIKARARIRQRLLHFTLNTVAKFKSHNFALWHSKLNLPHSDSSHLLGYSTSTHISSLLYCQSFEYRQIEKCARYWKEAKYYNKATFLRLAKSLKMGKFSHKYKSAYVTLMLPNKEYCALCDMHLNFSPSNSFATNKVV